jgi:hypothetical protein
MYILDKLARLTVKKNIKATAERVGFLIRVGYWKIILPEKV